MKKNYNENLVAGAAIRDDKGRRISKLFEASHPKMTVGYAKNLIMPDDPTEQEFNFRQSGDGVIEDGVAVIDKIKGNSVVWNQLMQNGNFADGKTGWTIYKYAGDVSSELTEEGYQINSIGDVDARVFVVRTNFIYIVGHTYLSIATVKCSSPTLIDITDGGATWVRKSIGNNFEQLCGIYISSATRKWIGVSCERLAPNVTFTLQSDVIIDLTQMFGAGNEPTTVEEFLQRKPKIADEFAYNEGTIVNNKVEKVVTTGRNLWDEEWEIGAYDFASNGSKIEDSGCIRSKGFIEVCNAAAIYLYIGNNIKTRVIFYDADKRFLISPPSLANAIMSIPKGSHYFTFYQRVSPTTYNHNICINLSDPTINGQYFPYEKHELDLSWVKEIKNAEGVKLFEDGMRSAGTAFDEVGKNKAVKRIGVIDMGEMTWYKRDDISPNMFASNGVAPNNKMGLCPIASINKTTTYDGTLVDGVLYWMRNYIMMYNSKFTTIDDFVNFVSGVPIYYELAEPIEVEYDEKSLTYPVVAGGTEEAIASEPSSAFRADIGYGIDAVKTILDLKARVEALEGK